MGLEMFNIYVKTGADINNQQWLQGGTIKLLS